jgi:Zn-dependent M16 (insulinase) family peptidase
MTHPFLEHVGDTYRDFTTVSHFPIEELDCILRELVHKPSGAKVIHIENNDPENLFCICFRTLPENGKGVAHILEHVVLCGSKKFPIKDPFFSMTRRSLNTFMNAFTGSDFTCYPAATQVEKDFYNLFSVYLDAVFDPELKLNSFLQEGCRVEFENPTNTDSPLVFKGIVYNEMKGSMTADSRLWHTTLKALFPDLPYAHNSGGDPKEIPQLTYQELIEFHKTHYHPSRALFFFYGNLPLKNHLDFLIETTLSQAEPLPSISPIPKQSRFPSPKSLNCFYTPQGSDSLEDKTILSIGWMTCPVKDHEEILALAVLDSLLMETDASFLKKSILQSGFCSQVDAHMDTEMSQVPYVLTLKGCKETEVDLIEQFVLDKLLELSKNPFPKHLIDAAIHQLELSRLEISADHGPFGLNLFFRAALAKQHGCDPKHALKVHSLFKTLLQKVEDPFYLPSLLKQYFLDNTHRVRIAMLPDPNLAQKELEEEKALLKSMQNKLSEEEKQKIVKQTDALEEMQKSIEEQNLDCLPKISLEDVPLLPKQFALSEQPLGPLTLYHHDCFTNSFVYADLLFDLPALTTEEIPYLQLLLALLPEIGAAGRTYEENLEKMLSYTGGIYTSSALHVQATDHKELRPSLILKGKALERHSSHLFDLMQDTLVQPDFGDLKRIEELIKQIASSLHNKVTKNALRYAVQLSLSSLCEASHFSNCCIGLPYYHFILNIMKDPLKQIPLVAEKLSLLHQRLFTFHRPHLVLSCDEKLYEKIIQKEAKNLLSLPQKTFVPWQTLPTLQNTPSQGRVIAAPVAYNVSSFSVAPYIHPHAPALSIASQLFENVILHSKIREIGGAYGAGASYSSLTGSFYFYSYRDPHIANTFAAFEEAVQEIALGKFSERDIEEAKLSVIQQLDTPVSPGTRATLAYGWLRDGRTKQLREEYRKKILELGASDIKIAVEKEFLFPRKKGIEVSFASKELLERQAKHLPVFPL